MPKYSELLAPDTWQHFEDLCADLFAAEWKDPDVVSHGRPGQQQKGVDIYGTLPTGGLGGVQCKKKRRWPPKTLTTKDIDVEIKNALEFNPPLKTFTIVTTAVDDIALQSHVRAINKVHKRRKLFKVALLGWDNLCRRIKRHDAVLRRHFAYSFVSSQPSPPIFGPWYASAGKLEFTGPELSISCREMARDLKAHPGSTLRIRLREADRLKEELAAAAFSAVDEREARFEKTHKLDDLREREHYLSRGITLMLSEPSIADLITGDPAKPNVAGTCVEGFVSEYLRPGRGNIHRTWLKYIISPKGRSDQLYGWIYLTPEEIALWSSRQLKLMKQFHGAALLSLFWELPEEILHEKGIPQAVHAILRAIDDGMSLETLRQKQLIDIISWEIGDD